MSAPVKTCSCGHALPTLADFRALPLVGFDSRDGEVLELRNHACPGRLPQTLALVLVEHPEDIRARLGCNSEAA